VSDMASYFSYYVIPSLVLCESLICSSPGATVKRERERERERERREREGESGPASGADFSEIPNFEDSLRTFFLL